MDKQERLRKLLEIANENRPSTVEVARLIADVIKSVKEKFWQKPLSYNCEGFP
jgi:hypothetical protein